MVGTAGMESGPEVKTVTAALMAPEAGRVLMEATGITTITHFGEFTSPMHCCGGDSCLEFGLFLLNVCAPCTLCGSPDCYPGCVGAVHPLAVSPH